MPYFLPSTSGPNSEPARESAASAARCDAMSDLKVFWGPEICRLEYLLHLLETGRIVDECSDGCEVSSP